ncbi:uncharacterized protein B0P05DRAFT_572662 [Gilbertella persicaria]|uniref:uncharacterized protein n=1 Tax=Gilbertella persicaria TaxID=101096 RepID=UPI00221F1F74|nr:uncharacterized protein B0P05DRAFT_572662 [Gilbertella persicaria]KAI8075949.1 hypothetical protein B0P05DRAFT_572662 [Gilbertella persicaria]
MVHDYQRLQTQNELKGSLLFKYRLAKGLTMISLLAIIVMAACSIFYPNYTFNSTKTIQQETIVTDEVQPERCHLPNAMKMPTSPDGSYTPPAPHSSLLKAVSFASNQEYQDYCQKYDQELGAFSDEWPYNQDGECGHWQEKYIDLHKKDMEMIDKYRDGVFPDDVDIEHRPRYISYICKEVPANSNRGCGGLADRMGDRAYLLNWAALNPLPLETIWERPHIDWSHDPAEMEALFTDDTNPFLGYQKVDLLNKKLKNLTGVMFPDGGNTDFNDLWNGTYIETRSNRGYIIRTFQLSQKYKKILNAMGLTKENAFRCITNFLFRPTIGSRRFLNAYKSLFGMKSVLSIGIQIRTDDNALANPQYDVNSLDKWAHFFKCAGELAIFKKEAHHKHVVFFLVTDSAHLRDEFAKMSYDRELIKQYFGEELADISSMVVTGLPIEHIEPDQIAKYIDVEVHKEVNLERMRPGVNSAYMENWLLGETQYRVISIQGYGKMASFYSGDDRTSISMPKPSLKHPFPVCNTKEAFTTFNWLSTQWSLG